MNNHHQTVVGEASQGSIHQIIKSKRKWIYFLAHCLQFDIVTTADTLEEIRKDIIDLCRAHIEFSYEHDNLDYLFSPAPKEVWAAIPFQEGSL